MRTRAAGVDQFLTEYGFQGGARGNVLFQLSFLFQDIRLQGRTMLDVGAGNGFYSIYAALADARRVVALEPEDRGSSTGAFDDLLRSRAALGLEDVIDPIPATLQEFESVERFDVAFLHASINHLDEDACCRLASDPSAQDSYLTVLKHLADRTAPGGDLVVVDCSPSNFFALARVRNPFAPTIEWEKHQRPELWVDLLTTVGFGRPTLDWRTPSVLRSAGGRVLGNRFGSYFFSGVFRLAMQRNEDAGG